jgi:Flp pilus assembly protein TadG
MKYSRHQRGVVTVLVAVTLPLLLFIIGMAVDFGHVFVNKTRLQNALDASALSAAIGINADVTHNVAAATAKGVATFNLFKAATGNTELATLNAGALVFDYSKTLKPWGAFDPATDNFAFVKVTSINMLNVTPLLIRFFRPNDIAIPAIATAGPVGTGYCNIMPFFLCAMVTPSVDYNCNDDTIKIDNSSGTAIAVLGQDGINDCYGYNKGQIYSLGQVSSSSNYSSGNYGLLSSLNGNGANQIKLDLQGKAISSCSQDRLSKTGVTSGPVSAGLNYRIDTLDINHNDYLTQEIYDSLSKQDIKALINPSITSTAYDNYKTANVYDGKSMSRVMPVGFADCSVMKNGTAVVPLVGNGCVFITQHVLGSPETVYVEYIDSCQQSGIFDPSHATLDGGYKIVLFKSLGSSDS